MSNRTGERDAGPRRPHGNPSRGNRRGAVRLLACVCGIALASAGEPARAQDAAPASETFESDAGSDFEIILMPYIWAASVDGDITVKGITADVDLDFHDALELLTIGAMGRGEVWWKGRVGLTTDLLYMDLEDDFDVTVGTRLANRPIGRLLERRGIDLPRDIDIDVFFRQVVWEFGAGVRPLDLSFGGADDEVFRTFFDVLGGGRYWFFKTRVEIDPPDARESVSLDWVEPYVGGRIGLGLFNRVTVAVRGDAGGFGVGSGSDLTWNLVAGVDVRLFGGASASLGYRILDLDYSRGSGDDRREAELQLTGPILGFGLRF